MWKTGSWEEIRLDWLRPDAWTAIISPDGRLAAIGYQTGEIELRSFPDGHLVRTLPGHPSRVQDSRFSPDGRRLASAGLDDSAKVWEVRSGRELMTLRAHFTHTVSVAFSSDGQRLAVSGYGGTTLLWDLVTGRELLTLGKVFGGHLAFSSDGSTLLELENEGTDFWRAPSWQEIAAKESAASGP